jgi:hypothetical protein
MDTDNRVDKVHGKNHFRFGNRLRLALLTAACIQCVTVPAGRAAAAETAVVIGPQADPLERYAADQLCMYLGQLFEIDAQPVTAAPAAAETLLLVGSPTTNPAVASAVGDDGSPEVSDQGVILQREMNLADGVLDKHVGGTLVDAMTCRTHDCSLGILKRVPAATPRTTRAVHPARSRWSAPVRTAASRAPAA